MPGQSLFTPTFDDLPSQIPLFPLSGAIVMPGTQLPLNIFEPRYLSMVNDVLSNHRMIGMIQPCQGNEESLCRTGCAGRITSFNETDDGRFIILLSGLCRFDVVEEVTEDSQYRMFRVDWSRFAADYTDEQSFDEPGLRQGLIDEVERFADLKEAKLDMEGLNKLDDLLLVNVLTCGLGFEPPDAQGLIECVELNERGALLSGLVQMGLQGGDVTPHATH